MTEIRLIMVQSLARWRPVAAVHPGSVSRWCAKPERQGLMTAAILRHRPAEAARLLPAATGTLLFHSSRCCNPARGIDAGALYRRPRFHGYAVRDAGLHPFDIKEATRTWSVDDKENKKLASRRPNTYMSPPRWRLTSPDCDGYLAWVICSTTSPLAKESAMAQIFFCRGLIIAHVTCVGLVWQSATHEPAGLLQRGTDGPLLTAGALSWFTFRGDVPSLPSACGVAVHVRHFAGSSAWRRGEKLRAWRYMPYRTSSGIGCRQTPDLKLSRRQSAVIERSWATTNTSCWSPASLHPAHHALNKRGLP